MFESPEAHTEVLYDLAQLYHKRRNFRRARRVFGVYLAAKPAPTPTKELYSMLGLSCTAMGDIAEGVKWYRKGVALDPGFREAWLHMFQAYKEGGLVRPSCVTVSSKEMFFFGSEVRGVCDDLAFFLQVKEAEQSFAKICSMDDEDKTRTMAAYRFRAHMLQCMGEHAAAAELLTRALAPRNGKAVQEQRVECLYLRGALPTPEECFRSRRSMARRCRSTAWSASTCAVRFSLTRHEGV